MVNLLKILIPVTYLIFIQSKFGLHAFLWILNIFYFFVLCQMSKYFHKCFGLSAQAPKFSTQMPWLFIIKIMLHN